MGPSSDVPGRILSLRLRLGVIAGLSCLVTAACVSTPARQSDAAVPPTAVAPTLATVKPTPLGGPPTVVAVQPLAPPTMQPTLVVVPTAVAPRSAPVRAPTQPPTPLPTPTTVPTPSLALAKAAVPRSISIPRLRSSAEIVPLGLEADGTMAVPSDPDTIGWYEFSAQVGRPGNAVVVGHVDWGGRLRAFGLLRNLQTDDLVTVVDALDRELTYRVQSVETVSADNPPDEFLTQTGPQEQLTLITCGGTFDHIAHQYLSRVIVRALRDVDPGVGSGG